MSSSYKSPNIHFVSFNIKLCSLSSFHKICSAGILREIVDMAVDESSWRVQLEDEGDTMEEAAREFGANKRTTGFKKAGWNRKQEENSRWYTFFIIIINQKQMNKICRNLQEAKLWYATPHKEFYLEHLECSTQEVSHRQGQLEFVQITKHQTEASGLAGAVTPARKEGRLAINNIIVL